MQEFNLQWVAECDSTSRVLKDQTKDSFVDVLALAAGRQTAGSGRMGRSWDSLEGNLHLSIAVPAASIPQDIRDVLPLAVGSLVVRWIKKHTGFQACLKWPNDILVDGCKVAGILCEGTFSGSEFRGVVIGIGINLKWAPKSDIDEYCTGALEQLIGCTMPPPRLAADSLARFFIDAWSDVSRPGIFNDWRSFGMASGHLWCGKDQHSKPWYRLMELDASGHLRLCKQSDGEDVIISSVHHDLRWSIQFHRKMLIADVGNSRTKVGVFSVGTDGKFQVSDVVEGQPGIAELLGSETGASLPPMIHALVVNPSGLESLREWAHLFGVEVREIQKKPVRVTHSRYDLAAIGADRLALLEAMHYLHGRGELPWPAMGVSLGTATTIDYIDGGGQHLGGFILAGLQTSVDAMSLKGSLLPKALDMKIDMDLESWPTNTIDAIRYASLGSTLAFLKSERQRLALDARLEFKDVSVLLTGGFAALVKSQWSDDFVETKSSLILLGAGILALNGR